MSIRWIKRLALVMAAVLCVGLFSGCGALFSKVAGKDTFSAADLVRGNLDLLYLDRYTDRYLATVGLTADQAHRQYEDGIAVEAAYFVDHFGIKLDQCPDGTEAKIHELFRQIYAHSKYEVGEQVQSGGIYLVSLTVYPINAMRNINNDALAEFGEDWAQRRDGGEFDGFTQEEFDAAFETAWAERLILLAASGLDDCEYCDPEVISVQVTPDEDGIYTISDNDFSRIDSLMIVY